MSKYIWDYLSLFPGRNAIKSVQATIAINSTLPSTFPRIWNQSSIRICADGGANRIYDNFEINIRDHGHLKLPNYIVGDLDSLRKDVLEYYRSRGTDIIKIDDQDTTDLEKSYNLLSQFSVEDVIILGGGGSLSHELGNFNASIKFKKYRSIFISEFSISFILQPGNHEILTKRGDKCSLLPIIMPCRKITTKGLQWELCQEELSMGELISKSNVSIGSKVFVENSDPLLWIFDLD